MTDRKAQHDTVGPIGAVATVPGEFLSSAIYEVVQGAWKLGEAVSRTAGKLRRK